MKTLGKIDKMLREERIQAREKAIQEEADQLHDQMQADIKQAFDPKKVNGPEYQDMVNVWMLRKLAELSLDVKSQKRKNIVYGQ